MTQMFDKLRRNKLSEWLVLGAGLTTFVIVVYGICLRYPFIQDDWGWMARFQGESASSILSMMFRVEGTLFQRPLAGLYLYGMYLVFGANPVPFHVIALATLIVNAVLVAAIVRFITRDRVVAYASSFIYVAGAAVHLETLLWAVGIHDLGGSLFFLLAMLLFLRGRRISGAMLYVAGCFFKESVIMLPFVLAAFAIIGTPKDSKERMVDRLKGLTPVAIAFVLLVAVKMLGVSPLSLGSEHSYSMGVFGRHVSNNIFSYVTWMSQSIDPFLSSKGATMKFVVNDLLLILMVATWVAVRTQSKNDARTLIFFLAWLVAGLLPAIFLVNHTYRYYALYSLPAFIAIVLVSLRVLLDAMRMPRMRVQRCIIALACLASLLSALQAHAMLRENFGQKTLADGTNWLIKRAATVIVVREGLQRQLPAPPEGATFLLGDCDLAAFDWESGPQSWYGNQSIRAYALENYASDLEGAYVLSPEEDGKGGDIRKKLRKVRLDEARIYAFRLRDAELIAVPAGAP